MWVSKWENKMKNSQITTRRDDFWNENKKKRLYTNQDFVLLRVSVHKHLNTHNELIGFSLQIDGVQVDN